LLHHFYSKFVWDVVQGFYVGDMEVVQFLPQLGTALWNLKVMYNQHVENGNEIKELQSFIQDYDHQIPILRESFQEGVGIAVGIAAFKNLEKDVMEATNKLERWSRNDSFFRLFNSAQQMQKLGKLHSKVMAFVQKSLGIANLSMLLDLQGTQATILESNAELKSLLITSIGSMHGTLPTEVRDEVVEASTSSFADLKFWEDVLAAVDNHNAGVSSLEEKNMYEDPITTDLMIDPIVASDGNTYCRWTIIDNNLTTNPFNRDEDLTIVIDNLTFRRGLFEKFPEQAQIFRQRRNQYRSHALALKAKGMWGDATLALHYVL